jgi:hypothetical protein
MNGDTTGYRTFDKRPVFFWQAEKSGGILVLVGGLWDKFMDKSF